MIFLNDSTVPVNRATFRTSLFFWPNPIDYVVVIVYTVDTAEENSEGEHEMMTTQPYVQMVKCHACPNQLPIKEAVRFPVPYMWGGAYFYHPGECYERGMQAIADRLMKVKSERMQIRHYNAHPENSLKVSHVDCQFCGRHFSLSERHYGLPDDLPLDWKFGGHACAACGDEMVANDSAVVIRWW